MILWRYPMRRWIRSLFARPTRAARRAPANTNTRLAPLPLADRAVPATNLLLTPNGPHARGIVLFNPTDTTAGRFATGFDAIDLTLGLDGKLYALTAGREVRAFDPATGTPLGTVTLPASPGGTAADYRGIAVNAAGQV